MTKENRRRLENYERATSKYLSDVYNDWSWAKQCAYDSICTDMVALNGYNLRVFNANTFGYSAGFVWNDKEGYLHLEYYTKDNTYSFMID